MGRLEGKVALISGAARGQGEAEARRFVAEGARVVIADILDDEGSAVATELGADKARYVTLDVSSEDGWNDAVTAATDAFGSLHILVNNAGILGAFTPLHKLPLDEFVKTLMVNQVGAFLGMKTAVPALRASGKASIVNISSTAGMWGVPWGAAYTS